MDQIIIHVDMDAFYASVEIRDDPSLRGKPLIIGSLPHERGVVATCSYEARKYGVHSGMNIKEAYRLCPQGIYRHPDFNKYRTVSQQLHEIWYSYASAAQAISLDEAYLDVTEQAGNLEGAREIAMTIKKRTREEVGLTCSVGVGYSKTAAKTASEEKKPDGYFEIADAEAFVDLVIDRDVRVLYTVGEKTAQKLNLAGIYSVRDIQNNSAKVRELLGKSGAWITQIAYGIDQRKVTPYRPEDAKSIGREVTFQHDVSDYGFLKDVLLLLSLCVEHRARGVGLQGGGVTLKLTYADMTGITRSRLTDSCESAYQIYRIAADLLNREEEEPVRLIGVSIYNLARHRHRQLSLFDYDEDPLDEANREMKKRLENLERKYGLDFAGNLEKIYSSQVLYRTIEYMRKRSEN
ncbi:MAG: DNA polymerase IV [Erysipelotrichaceae bacterium]|nr:DNA polymerase IV [Erysipelotrichaceae bacterium]